MNMVRLLTVKHVYNGRIVIYPDVGKKKKLNIVSQKVKQTMCIEAVEIGTEQNIEGNAIENYFLVTDWIKSIISIIPCMHVCSVAQSCKEQKVMLFVILGLQPTRFLCPWDFPGKNTEVDCHSLLQGIFPTQGWNLHLLHCRRILYH